MSVPPQARRCWPPRAERIRRVVRAPGRLGGVWAGAGGFHLGAGARSREALRGAGRTGGFVPGDGRDALFLATRDR